MLSELLYSLWAALSTLGAFAVVLAAGLALFALTTGIPAWRHRRGIEARIDASLAQLSPDVRARMTALAAHLDDAPAILAADPTLTALLAGLPATPEEILHRIIAETPPAQELQEGEDEPQ